jgi:hypothetical protein
MSENQLQWRFRVLVILWPLAFVVLWHSLNLGYPFSEEVDFAQNAVTAHKTFQNNGIGAGFKKIYWERTRKPIIQPLLLLPALTLTKGDIRKSVALTTIGLYMFFLIYSFLSFSLFLPPKRAALAHILVGSAPVFVWNAYTFNNYLPQLAFTAAALYHFYRFYSQGRPRDGFVFACFFALGSCLRPAEFILIFSIPLVWLGRRNFIFLLPALLIPLCWYLPFAKETTRWIIGSTLESQSILTLSHPGDQLGFLTHIIKHALGYTFLTLFLISTWTPSFLKNRFDQKTLNAALTMAGLPIAAMLTTQNRDLPYLVSSAYIFYFLFAVTALSPSRFHWELRRNIFLSALIVLPIFLTMTILRPQSVPPSLLQVLGEDNMRPDFPLRKTDPAVMMHQKLEELLPQNQQLSIGYVFNPEVHHFIIGPQILRLLSSEKNQEWYFKKCDLSDFKSKLEWLNFCHDHYDYLVAGPLEGDPTDFLNTKGFKVLSKFALTGRDGVNGTFLLVHNIR